MPRIIVPVLFILATLTACASGGQVAIPTSEEETPVAAAVDEPSGSSADAVDSPSSDAFTEGLRRLAAKIVDGLDPDSRNAIAPHCLTRTDGEAFEQGEVLIEALLAELVGACDDTGRCEVVDRNAMNRICEEVALGMSDLMDESKCVKIGRHAGATLILSGTADPWAAESLRVSARLIEVETTKVAVWCHETMPMPPGMERVLDPQVDPAAEELLAVSNPDSEFNVEVWADRAIYRFGDPVTVFVRTDHAGYLYLFDIDAEGNQTQLMPNLFQQEPVYVEAGETYMSSAGWFSAGPPAGRGYLKALITAEPNSLVGTDFSDGGTFKSLSRARTRGIVVDAMKSGGGFATFHVIIEE